METSDVVVVGAGPGGSTAAYWLAQHGLRVTLLEKTAFPREKVCGDGLTPRSVKALRDMQIPLDAEDGWVHNKGLRLVTGKKTIEVDWPDLATWPNYGLVRTREDFDEILARHAEKAGVTLHERAAVTGPILDENSDRVLGVRAKMSDGVEREFRSSAVIAADGNSSRFSLALGVHKRDDRPMAVALRTYYTSPRHEDDYLEAWLELWDHSGSKPVLMPGYGWIFGVGDGTSNVGLGVLNASGTFGKVDTRALLTQWLRSTPPEWGYVEENRTQPVRGAALPMAFNRTPAYTRGTLLIGDAAGMVNPFNGEGIAYAMESGKIAAEVITDALMQSQPQVRDQILARYPEVLEDRYGGYYRAGRKFVKVIANPRLMKMGLRAALSRPTLLHLTMKLLANLSDPEDGDALDRIVSVISKLRA